MDKKLIKYRQAVTLSNGSFDRWHYWGYVDGNDTFTSPIYGKSYKYTGLKDKNRKEIYEADLLKHAKTGAIGEVVWYGAEWGIRWEPNSEYPAYNSLQDCWTTLYYEVIGNKFETPGLLEQ